jgi:enoyl-CoA hydratase/carnithine racemase
VSEARRLANDIAALPPTALAWCKRCIMAGAPQGYEMELAGTAELLADEETQRRVRAFLEGKR